MRRLSFSSLLLAFLLQLPAAAAELLYLNTPQGADRLVGAALRNQFFALQPYVESQQNLAFCGPASIAAVMNSLEIERPAAAHLYPYRFFTQDNVFTPETQRIKSHLEVASRGMTLAELSAFIDKLGARATRYPADELNLDRLRGVVRASLAKPGQRLIVNYSRKPLGQAGNGHISPLAAYDEASDSVLLLDVAKFKYPPVWIKLAHLLGAMQTTDPDSGKSRGLIVVEKP
jgi:hypothetical protein